MMQRKMLLTKFRLFEVTRCCIVSVLENITMTKRTAFCTLGNYDLKQKSESGLEMYLWSVKGKVVPVL